MRRPTKADTVSPRNILLRYSYFIYATAGRYHCVLREVSCGEIGR